MAADFAKKDLVDAVGEKDAVESGAEDQYKSVCSTHHGGWTAASTFSPQLLMLLLEQVISSSTSQRTHDDDDDDDDDVVGPHARDHARHLQPGHLRKSSALIDDNRRQRPRHFSHGDGVVRLG